MAVSARAAAVNGIRIESPRQLMVVFVNGEQVSLPTYSCFVANVKGALLVEVYEATPDGRIDRNRLLHRERLYCSGRKVKDIYVEAPADEPHGRPRPEHGEPPVGRHEPVMSAKDFDRFIDTLNRQSFDSERQELLEHALRTSSFTTDQCVRLMNQKMFSFDSERVALLKKLYPKVTDKANFYRAVERLTFQMDRDEVNTFVKQYHENR